MTAASEPLVVATPRLRRARVAVLAHPKILAGVAILGFFIFLTVAGPLLDATLWARQGGVYDPQFGFDTTIAHPSAPSTRHWLGTSSTGRDVFSMLAYAARPSPRQAKDAIRFVRRPRPADYRDLAAARRRAGKA